MRPAAQGSAGFSARPASMASLGRVGGTPRSAFPPVHLCWSDPASCPPELPVVSERTGWPAIGPGG
eukprot:14742833-Alexandrium_andersonii.AAC.1